MTGQLELFLPGWDVEPCGTAEPPPRPRTAAAEGLRRLRERRIEPEAGRAAGGRRAAEVDAWQRRRPHHHHPAPDEVPMTPDQLRARIAADCPHRLDDYLAHLAGREPTPGVIRLWQEEHAVSSRPDIEAELDWLYRQAADGDDYAEIKGYLVKASQIRKKITDTLKEQP